MKTHYLKKILRIPVFTALLCQPVINLFGQDFPVPDLAFNFDEDISGWKADVKDISGNSNNGYWYNYWDGTEDMYAGYKAEEGVFGGAWYISGYHACCEEMASSSMDFILLAGNTHPKDVAGYKDTSEIFHRGFEAMTFAFWHKSDRIYSGNYTPCPPDQPGMHEQEILVSIGNRNGIAINNFKGYYEVRIGRKEPEMEGVSQRIQYLWDGADASSGIWRHIAVVYDGADNGKLSVYINGELAVPYTGDPNPLETGYAELYPAVFSSEIGAQNAGGLFGDPGDGYWASGVLGKYCITEADTAKYRTGWPANGYIDDFVFYKNKALTKEQLQQLQNEGINSLTGYANQIDPATTVRLFNVYPNPSNGKITIRGNTTDPVGVKIYNILGKQVYRGTCKSNQPMDVSSLEQGIYLLRINEKHTERLVIN